jgi:hypothetical protein
VLVTFSLEECLSLFLLKEKELPKDRDAGTIPIAIGTRTTPSLSRNFGICLPTFHYLLVTFSLEGKRTPEEVKRIFLLFLLS